MEGKQLDIEANISLPGQSSVQPVLKKTKFLASFADSATEIDDCNLDVDDEMLRYKKEPVLGMGESPLHFWKKNKNIYPAQS